MKKRNNYYYYILWRVNGFLEVSVVDIPWTVTDTHTHTHKLNIIAINFIDYAITTQLVLWYSSSVHPSVERRKL